MLFQGQEFASSAPFLYFADHEAELARRRCATGGASSSRSFPAPRDPEMRRPRCRRPATRRRSSGASSICASASGTPTRYALHRDLLALRRDDPVIAAGRLRRLDGAVLAAAVLRAALRRRRRATIGCWSSTSAPTAICRPCCPSRCWRRPPATRWRLQLVAARRRATAAAGTPAGAHERRVAHSRRVGRAAARRAAIDEDACGARWTTDSTRVIALRRTTTVPSDGEPAAAPRVAGHQRARRLRLGHRRRACVTRRYHGLLVAALPAPLGRIVMLNHLLERVRLPDARRRRGSATRTRWPARTRPTAPITSIEFRLELGLPVWRYEIDGYVIEKRVLMPHGQNTVHVTYRLLEGDGPVRLTLRPSVQFRGTRRRSTSRRCSPTRLTAVRRPLRARRPAAASMPPRADAARRRTRRFTLDERGVSSVP